MFRSTPLRPHPGGDHPRMHLEWLQVRLASVTVCASDPIHGNLNLPAGGKNSTGSMGLDLRLTGAFLRVGRALGRAAARPGVTTLALRLEDTCCLARLHLPILARLEEA